MDNFNDEVDKVADDNDDDEEVVDSIWPLTRDGDLIEVLLLLPEYDRWRRLGALALLLETDDAASPSLLLLAIPPLFLLLKEEYFIFALSLFRSRNKAVFYHFLGKLLV